MNKKIVVISLLFVLTIIAVGAVCANADNSKAVGETTTIGDKEGILRSYTGEHSGQASFIYNDDGYKITVTGNASIIEEVID